MKAARIVVLGIALAAGGIAALLASKGDNKQEEPAAAKVAPLETVDVLVAKADITTGQVISNQDIGWQVWPAAAAGPSFIRKSEKPNAIDEFTGAIVRTPFISGEPIRESKVIRAKGSGFMAAILPQGMRAVSTEISPETGAGGFILPNDHVDVILSRRDKAAEKSTGVEVHVSETILTNVRVLAIDQAVEEKNGQKVVVGKTATLELMPQQAETLALSRQLGTLSLALRSLVDSQADKPDQPLQDKDNSRGSINTVRFGVTTTTTPR
jgi:pilus assembly protein CpaB